ncbi:MAG: hypothetical protein NVSMB53_00040 [Gemmatimonadaceae bacterium]
MEPRPRAEKCQAACIFWTILCTDWSQMRVNLRTAKRPFNIHAVLRRIRQEVKQFPDAAMFDLASKGHATPFHQLVACIVSVRTRDEVSLPAGASTLQDGPHCGKGKPAKREENRQPYPASELLWGESLQHQ